MYNLFLDDIRTIEMVYQSTTTEWVIVRSYDAFVAHIKQHGLPSLISFDNDLGLDSNGEVAKDGIDCAKWLVYQSFLDISTLKFSVHSANPVAKERIKSLLDGYIKFLNNE